MRTIRPLWHSLIRNKINKISDSIMTTNHLKTGNVMYIKYPSDSEQCPTQPHVMYSRCLESVAEDIHSLRFSSVSVGKG
jgi:hypothetical protein